MKAALFALALAASSAAFAQPVNCKTPSGQCAAQTFRANATSGGTALGVATGARVSFDSPADTRVLSWDGTALQWDAGVRAAHYGNGTNGNAGTVQGLSFTGTSTNVRAAVGASVVVGDGTTPFEEISAGGTRLPGVATANLATCNAGAAGTLQYDFTVNTLKVCNGTTWVQTAFGVGQQFKGSFAAMCENAGGCVENSNFRGSYRMQTNTPTGVKADYISCMHKTAGTGGGAVFELSIVRTDTGAVFCTCQAPAGTCSVSPGTAYGCRCNGNLVGAGVDYGVRLTTNTACTLNPTDILCNVEITNQ